MPPKLLVNNDNEVFVDLLPGKLSKNLIYKQKFKAQSGMGCLLFSVRRISIVDTEQEEIYQAYKTLKTALKNNVSISNLVNVALSICKDFAMDAEKIITSHPYFKAQCSKINATPSIYLRIMTDSEKWCILYEEIVRVILCPLLNIHTSTWSIEDGVEGLKEALRTQGPHVFIGKLGYWCHTEMVRFPQHDAFDREVYAFPKNSHQPHANNFMHAIVVDQIKTIDGNSLVFFRDPYDESDYCKKEKVYTLKYESFVERLATMQCISQKDSNSSVPFGLVSNEPERLAFKLKYC